MAVVVSWPISCSVCIVTFLVLVWAISNPVNDILVSFPLVGKPWSEHSSSSHSVGIKLSLQFCNIYAVPPEMINRTSYSTCQNLTFRRRGMSFPDQLGKFSLMNFALIGTCLVESLAECILFCYYLHLCGLSSIHFHRRNCEAWGLKM